jgi:uncharacterized membrane protein YcaP (DUF421 family)
MITSIVRTAILYVFITLGIRLMGKRQIGDMQPNELVITLLISEIAAIPLQDSTQPLLFGIIAIFVLIILEIAVSVLSMKNIFIRKLLNGKSIVIIKDGVIDQQAMSDVRMTVVDLIELLRGQNVFDISTVAFAVLEVNGELSVLLKSKEQPATLKDLRIEKSEAVLPLPVITDGKILNETLKALNVSEEMVYKQLKKNNTNVKKVFLMTMDKDGNSTIINKGKKV